MNNRTSRWLILAALLTLPLGTGCVVGQAPGQGLCTHRVEATTGAKYWLYLPAGYREQHARGTVHGKRPLVMTFHGMKPFDDANRQIREWQQEADRYGFVVCAPELLVPDIFGPLPLANPDHPSLKRDEQAILAIMDELFRTVEVDSAHVLATGWSYGGYVVHYMANHHPDRFSCVVVKQCNFNANLLEPANVPRYRDHKVAIYYTENDFAICRRESREAARWYSANGFDLTYAVLEKKGHERTPSVAADFFAKTCDIDPKTPPVELAQLQVVEVTPPLGSRATGVTPRIGSAPSEPPHHRPINEGRPFTSENQSTVAGTTQSGAAPTTRIVGGDRADRFLWNADADWGLTSRDAPLRSRTVLPPPRAVPTPRRRLQPSKGTNDGPARIVLSSTIGVAPLLVSYSVALPRELQGSDVLWMENGAPISNELNGQKVFNHSGKRDLSVLVTAPNGAQYRSSRTITVIAPAAKRRK